METAVDQHTQLVSDSLADVQPCRVKTRLVSNTGKKYCNTTTP